MPAVLGHGRPAAVAASGEAQGRRAGVLRSLDEVAALPPNWDGYGADPVRPAVAAAARRFLEGLADDLFVPSPNGQGSQDPAVVPTTSGTVQLEWHAAGRILELEFESPTTIRFLQWWPQRGLAVEDAFPVADDRRAERLIRWAGSGDESD